GGSVLSVSSVGTSTGSPALRPRDVLAFGRADIDLPRTRDLLLRVGEHLLPLRDPAGGSRDREQDREDRYREPHRLVDQSRIEVDVGVELPSDEVIVRQSDSLELQGDVKERIASGYVEDEIGNAFDDRRPRGVGLGDTVTKTHQSAFTGLDARDERRNFVDRCDL